MRVKTYHLGIRIDKDMQEKLEKLSEENDFKLSDYCRRVLKTHIEEMEDK